MGSRAWHCYNIYFPIAVEIMASTTTGSWNLHKCVKDRWSDASLDTTFRNEWADPTDTDYQPLQFEGEARPETPHPYCVVTIERPVTLGHSTGVSDSDTERRYTQTSVQFEIYAQSAASEDGKDIAQRMAAAVGNAFDQKTLWPIDVDYIMQTERTSDWCDRLSDLVYRWTLRYEVELDTVWDRKP